MRRFLFVATVVMLAILIVSIIRFSNESINKKPGSVDTLEVIINKDLIPEIKNELAACLKEMFDRDSISKIKCWTTVEDSNSQYIVLSVDSVFLEPISDMESIPYLYFIFERVTDTLWRLDVKGNTEINWDSIGKDVLIKNGCEIIKTDNKTIYVERDGRIWRFVRKKFLYKDSSIVFFTFIIDSIKIDHTQIPPEQIYVIPTVSDGFKVTERKAGSITLKFAVPCEICIEAFTGRRGRKEKRCFNPQNYIKEHLPQTTFKLTWRKLTRKKAVIR